MANGSFKLIKWNKNKATNVYRGLLCTTTVDICNNNNCISFRLERGNDIIAFSKRSDDLRKHV